MGLHGRLEHRPISLQGSGHLGGTAEGARWAVKLLDYIGRGSDGTSVDPGQEPCTAFLVGGLPKNVGSDRKDARAWLRREIRENERSNGRIGEYIMVNFPRSFTQEECVQAIKRFTRDVTNGFKIPCFAGLHMTGADAKNPHAHIVFRDRMSIVEREARRGRGERVVLGKNVVGWLSKLPTKTELGSTERFRRSFERACNEVAAAKGDPSRMDLRSKARRNFEQYGTPMQRPTIEDRARMDLKQRARETKSILQHADARMDTAIQRGGSIDAQLLKFNELRERLQNSQDSAQERWQRSVQRNYKQPETNATTPAVNRHAGKISGMNGHGTK